MTELENRYIKAKRALFDKVHANLNEMQRKAVHTTQGPLLVIAGAGSGKTTVLVNRIAQIIRYGNAYYDESTPPRLSAETVAAFEAANELSSEDIEPLLTEFSVSPCAPWNVLAITFTNKAAKEIVERLSRVFEGEDTVQGIWAGTFHSICMRILRSHSEKLGYGGTLTIYDADDSKKLLTAVMKELNIDEKQFTVRSVANEISRAKEKLLAPEDYEEQAVAFREKTCAKIYKLYQSRLGESNALDFDDIIMQTVFLLRREDDVRRYYANKFKYICVDEYQDTNHAQFELCSLLASEWRNIMVVGDDDQSIYRFRGATVENILGFDSTYPDAKVIKLEQNYRSSAVILNAANAVISKNTKRRPKRLWTDSEDGEKIKLEECEDQNEEARKIADLITRLVSKNQYSYRDFAILYRVNAQSSTIERTFAKSGLPYRIYGGLRFGDRKEIKDVVAYLQFINNTSDRVRLKRIINEPKRKIGDTTIAAVEAIADENGITMFEVMCNADKYVALSRGARTLMAFAEMINKLRSMLDGGCPLDVFTNAVLDESGYRQMLVAAGEAEKDRLENIEEFVSGVIEYMNNNEEPTLTGFLEETALVADVDRFDESADAAVLMTIHSSKGLEFPVVIIPGLEEGIFPGSQSLIDPSELEEERRLAYVALTRAKKELYLYHTDCRLLYGRTMRNPPSRFIADIPEELINKKEKKKNRGFSSEYSSWGSYSTEKPRVYISTNGGQGSAPKADVLTVNRPVATPSARKDIPSFAPGDRVKHPAFGEGEVLSVKVMGSDKLYEIIFDRVGTKKLMGSYAKLTKA